MKKFLRIAVAVVLVVIGLSAAYRLMMNNINRDRIVTLDTNLVSSETTDSAEVNVKKIRVLDIDEDQVIALLGPIDRNAAIIANEITMKSHNGKPLFLAINSPGGSVLDGAMIITAMEASRVPVYTVCMQMCASMAAIIHQYGKQRFMLDRSLLMFHNAYGGVEGTIPGMLSQLNAINKYIQRFDLYISNRAGLSQKEFKGIINTDLWMDAEDSVEKQFADGLVYLEIEMSAQPEPEATQQNTKTQRKPFDVNLQLKNNPFNSLRY